LKIALDEPVLEIAEAIAAAGGRAILVGGRVRDHLLGIESKDADIEVCGLSLEQLERTLSRFGEVAHIGRAFGVFKVKGVDVDFSLPRRDSKVGQGHKGFKIDYAPDMPFEEAARRRDLTINSIGYDIRDGKILDPFGGRRDLELKVLRATDPAHFPEDPLRGLRVAGFAARFEMTPNEELATLCAGLDLSELSPERVFEEMGKILLKPDRPSIAFEFLRETELLRFFPELLAMIDVEQEPDWHPEGDVYVHTMMVIDEAAKLREGDADDLSLMYGSLLHDVGKPVTTSKLNGRIRSYGHDLEGVGIAQRFMTRLRAPGRLVSQVGALVRHHLAPGLYYQNGAKAKAYRRLARDLDDAGVSMELLLRVATADHFGRTTEDALARHYPAGDWFKKQIESLEIEETAPRDVVLGRHLLARDFAPGPHLGEILERCREVQDETGWDDPERILDRVLGSHPEEQDR
jgi:tRNA nucleotidyltransferase (CCA-adding enzyme)